MDLPESFTRSPDEFHLPPPPPMRPPEVYKIIPLQSVREHPAFRYPEVRTAGAAICQVSNLRKPPFVTWHSEMDLMDWLGHFFGFQDANVRNQRENLVLTSQANKCGTALHSTWWNYDDINEYFCSGNCFKSLKWPIDVNSNFFAGTGEGKRVGKTGFLEWRLFWNVLRSFDRVWTTLILFLQAAVIVGYCCMGG